jgi:hypothetical protein
MGRRRIDLNSPLANELRMKIVQGTFISEGTMIAFPLCFPGASAPIPADESHITALDVTERGIVHGGTSGRRVHLFVAAFHGATGAVFDMGVVEDADRCVAVCCGRGRFIACVNGPDGGRLIRRRLGGMPSDLIQEWGFSREPFEDLGTAMEGERIIHAVADSSKEKVIVQTEGHLISVGIESGEIEVIGEVSGSGRLAVGSRGSIFGPDEPGSLWRYNPKDGTFTRNAVQLPEGSWGKYPLSWARNPVDGRLYTADDEGNLFSFTEEEGFSAKLGRVPLTPAGPMAVTFDGRLFGACGEEIANLFCYDPAAQRVTRLGVAVSVIERRRYGYVFGDAVVGRDGQIFFGEDDDLGHLWIYFPSIRP